MYRDTTLIRTGHDTLEDRRASRRTGRDNWAWLAAPHARPPQAISEAAVAECRCPTDCIRDHENE